MKKSFLLVLFLISLAGYSQERQESLVSVTGEGTVRIIPDEVLIRARIEHTGKSVSEVKEQNDKVVDAIIKFLRSQDIPARNFQTEYITLNKDYNFQSKDTFYSANQAIAIRLKDLDKYESLISGLLDSGLNRIDGIQFDSSQREALESEARKKAVVDAREKAMELAEAIDQQIGKATQINELSGGNRPSPMYRAMEVQSADSGQQETLAPGEMVITIRVNASFLLQ